MLRRLICLHLAIIYITTAEDCDHKLFPIKEFQNISGLLIDFNKQLHTYEQTLAIILSQTKSPEVHECYKSLMDTLSKTAPWHVTLRRTTYSCSENTEKELVNFTMGQELILREVLSALKRYQIEVEQIEREQRERVPTLLAAEITNGKIDEAIRLFRSEDFSTDENIQKAVDLYNIENMDNLVEFLDKLGVAFGQGNPYQIIAIKSIINKMKKMDKLCTDRATKLVTFLIQLKTKANLDPDDDYSNIIDAQLGRLNATAHGPELWRNWLKEHKFNKITAFLDDQTDECFDFYGNFLIQTLNNPDIEMDILEEIDNFISSREAKLLVKIFQQCYDEIMNSFEIKRRILVIVNRLELESATLDPYDSMMVSLIRKSLANDEALVRGGPYVSEVQPKPENLISKPEQVIADRLWEQIATATAQMSRRARSSRNNKSRKLR